MGGRIYGRDMKEHQSFDDIHLGGLLMNLLSFLVFLLFGQSSFPPRRLKMIK